MTITELILALLAMLVTVVLGVASSRSHAECPPGWYVGTCRPSGRFSCVKTPARGICDDLRGCDDTAPDLELPGQIYCTGGMVPVTNANGIAVGCQRVTKE